jgi:tetratricopeptide (TPR) repeat protein
VRHFLVVNGINSEKRFVVCADYDNLYRVISFEELVKLWSDAGFLQILISVQSEFESIYERAYIYESNGSYKQALDLYLKASHLKSDNYLTFLGAANCYYNLGDKTAARLNYAKAYELNKTDPLLLNNYASTLMDLKIELDSGLKLIDQAVTESENLYKNAESEEDRLKFLFRWITCLVTLAEYRSHFQEYNLALAGFIKSYELTPAQYVDMRDRRILQIVDCYKKLGHLGTAREWELKLSSNK